MLRKILSTLALFLFPGALLIAQNRYHTTYPQLKDFEGQYQAGGTTTLNIAASPWDTLLYAIYGKAKYPLYPADQDVFLNNSRNKVSFLRNAAGKVNAYMVGKDTFHLLNRDIHYPPTTWYPRLTNDPQHYQYTYTPPAQLADGLTSGTLQGSGLDEKLLTTMVQQIAAGQYPNFYSMLILRHGKLVFEEYFYDQTRDSLQEQRSATKSVISALTGIAIHQGLIRGVQEKLSTLLPEYHFKNPSPLKDRITLQDLLDNQSGVSYDIAWDKAAGNEMDMGKAADWIQYTYDLPMVDTPGTVGRYNSGNPITAGFIIQKKAGIPLREYAAKNLFDPLQITGFQWNFRPDPSNENNYCQVFLKPRDMAKFGQLYLQNGVWKGKQIVPAAWVKESTSQHSVVQNVNYGYLWWLKYLDAGNKRYQSFAAQGNGGQKIYVFRELDLVVVTTGANFNSKSPADELIAKFVLPAFN